MSSNGSNVPPPPAAAASQELPPPSPSAPSPPSPAQESAPAKRHSGGGSGYEAAARGGHLAGNFPNYYNFHQPAPRVAALLGQQEESQQQQEQQQQERDSKQQPCLLQQLLLRSDGCASSSSPLLVSDWGCNSGDLTVALCQRLQQQLAPMKIAALGLDLDEDLIKKAQGRQQDNKEITMTFAAADLVAEKDKVAELMQDFVKRHNKEKVDLLTIFSTTMWIHLRYGDDGLKELLRFAASWSRCLVVEPQDASSYKTARTRLKRLGLDPAEYFSVLNPATTSSIFGSEALGKILLLEDEKGGGGFDEMRNLGKSSSWNRDLLVFWRREEKGEDSEAKEEEKTKKRPREEEAENV